MKKLTMFALLAALTVSSVGCQTCGGLFGGRLFNRNRGNDWDCNTCETCCESGIASYGGSYGGEVIMPGPSRIVPGATTRVLPSPE